ncbi:MAG: WecB/TagA/CpsF family glycosyltransferase [Anditalea sp.]
MIFGYDLYLNGKRKLIEELKEKITNNQTSTIISLNSLKLRQGSKDIHLKKLFQSGTYIIPDGQSMAFGEFLVNGNKISAISGAELMVELINDAHLSGHKIFFLGSPEKLLKKVVHKIKYDYPDLIDKVGIQHGYYEVETEEDKVIQLIADFKPDYLFVAFGSPRKEKFILDYKDRLNSKVIMGVGGSFEYFVGDVKLNSTLKKLGLRWLERTLQDPLRLSKRYLICNSYFFYSLVKEIFVKRLKHYTAKKGLQ